MGIGQNLFSEQVNSQWHRLPREVGESPSLEVFNNHVDVALRDTVSGHGLGLALVISEILSNRTGVSIPLAHPLTACCSFHNF